MKEMKLKNMILRVRVWDANEIPKLEILRARILECSIRVEANARRQSRTKSSASALDWRMTLCVIVI